MNTGFFDTLETRSADEREAALALALPALLRAARAVPGWIAALADVVPEHVSTRAALAGLPVLRKSELMARQQATRGTDAFGGFSALGWRHQQALRPARQFRPGLGVAARGEIARLASSVTVL